MRKILTGLLLTVACAVFLSPMTAHAAGLVSPAFVYQTAVSSITTNIITVATSTVGGAPFVAAQMDTPKMANRVAIEIDNIDTTANLWCVTNSTVPAASAGRKIVPGASWVVNMMDNFYTQNYSTITNTTTTVSTPATIYCLSDGAAATKAAVTQAY